MTVPLIEDFLNNVKSSKLDSDPNELISYTYWYINTLLLDNNYDGIDIILKEVIDSISKYDISTLLALLTITYTAHNKLPMRKEFFMAVQITLLQRGIQDIDKILKGLR